LAFAAHIVQALDPVREIVLAGHVLQSVDLVMFWYVPSSQRVQTTAPVLLYLPESHSLQIDSEIAANAVLAFPATQSVQVSEPDDALYVPAVQELQLAPLSPV